MTPGQSAGCAAMAWLLGCGAGLVYGFLRPLRSAHTTIADLLFFPILVLLWLRLNFAVCHGDLRLGYTVTMLGGTVLFDRTVGTLLNPIFQRFWTVLNRMMCLFSLPGKKFFKKVRKNGKKILAIRKK